MAHKKHIKKRRRSPIRFLFLFIILIAALIGIVVFTLHSKLGKVQTKELNQSQLVTVNNDSNMSDYTNMLSSELIHRQEVCLTEATVQIRSSL